MGRQFGTVCYQLCETAVSESRRRQKHVALVDTRSQVLQHPVLVVISVAESARQNSGSGVIFVLTVRFLASTASSSFIDVQQQAIKQAESVQRAAKDVSLRLSWTIANTTRHPALLGRFVIVAPSDQTYLLTLHIHTFSSVKIASCVDFIIFIIARHHIA